MSEPILAPEEIEALMAEVAPTEKAEAIFASLPPIHQPEHVEPFHFSDADDDSPSHYPMFVNLQERLVEMMDEQWDELFKRDVTLQVDRLEKTIYKDLITVEYPQVYFVFEVEEYGRMMVCFDTAIIVAFVDAMLGGEGESSDNPQTLSPVEMRLAERISDKLAETLNTLWKPVQPMTFTSFKLDYDPQFLAVTSATEKCFSAYFEAKLSDDLTGNYSMHYPHAFLEPFIEKLRATVSDEPKETDTAWTHNLMERISLTPTNLRFELGRCQIDIGTFLSLKAGDFLPLKTRTHDPCTLWVEETPLFYAKPGEQEGTLAAEILDPIQPGDPL